MRAKPGPLTRAALAAILVAGCGVAARAQTIDRRPPSSRTRAANLAALHTRSVVGPALPVPPTPPSDPPREFLLAARIAVLAGRTGKAQEALERAETRLLDRVTPPSLIAVPDGQRIVQDIAAAWRALAAHDRAAAISAIDAALAADTGGTQSASFQSTLVATQPPTQLASPAVIDAQPPPLVYIQPPPAVAAAPPPATYALLPGHWALHGARHVWVPPETTLRRVQSADQVPGRYVWRNGAYVWAPAHLDFQ
ncbi:MAG: YXWGXW repeat-containing protein [Alphaproteobacteria bacterium]|nr:YXWGXW repeat-containing protein [Alphaproteobacteria bacterium]